MGNVIFAAANSIVSSHQLKRGLLPIAVHAPFSSAHSLFTAELCFIVTQSANLNRATHTKKKLC